MGNKACITSRSVIEAASSRDFFIFYFTTSSNMNEQFFDCLKRERDIRIIPKLRDEKCRQM